MGACCMNFFSLGASGERAASTGRFPRRNWVVVILMRALINLIFDLPLPSMHQFITNPSASSSNESEVDIGYRAMCIKSPLLSHNSGVGYCICACVYL